MNQALIDRLTAMVLIIISFFLYNTSNNYPVSASIFPKSVLIILISLSAVLFLITFKKNLVIKYKQKNSSKINLNQLINIALLSIFYCFLLKYINYFITTPIFTFLSIFVLKVRNWKTLIGVPILTTSILFLIFRTLLSVPFPR